MTSDTAVALCPHCLFVAKTPPLLCNPTALAAKAGPLPCVSHLCLVCPTAFAAKDSASLPLRRPQVQKFLDANADGLVTFAEFKAKLKGYATAVA